MTWRRAYRSAWPENRSRCRCPCHPPAAHPYRLRHTVEVLIKALPGSSDFRFLRKNRRPRNTCVSPPDCQCPVLTMPISEELRVGKEGSNTCARCRSNTYKTSYMVL